MEIMSADELLAALVDLFQDFFNSLALLLKVVQRTNIRILSRLNDMSHLEPRRNLLKAMKHNLGPLKTLNKILMKLLLHQHVIPIKVLLINTKLTTEPIHNGMHVLVGTCCPAVLVLSLEVGVVVGGQEAGFV